MAAVADRPEAMMREIWIKAGAWEAGRGVYEDGLFSFPNGASRGLEEVVDVSVEDRPVAALRRRIGVADGLRSALRAVGPLPRPLDLAASVIGLGLGALGGELHTLSSLHLRFTDGAIAAIEADPATADLIRRDHAVIRLALARRGHAGPMAAHLLPAPILALPAPSAPASSGVGAGTAFGVEREIPSIFEYEKRKGRLRRLALANLAVAKAPDDA